MFMETSSGTHDMEIHIKDEDVPSTPAQEDDTKPLPDPLRSIAPATSLPNERHTWNSNEEITAILIATDRHEQWQKPEVCIRPRSGSMVLYDRQRVRSFRKDGYCWKKKKSSRHIREDHMKLKVQGIECIYGSYVHSAILPTFHRRSYWLLQNPSIVLVHYLNVPLSEEGKQAAMPALTIQPHKERWSMEELLAQLNPMFASELISIASKFTEKMTEDAIIKIATKLLAGQKPASYTCAQGNRCEICSGKAGTRAKSVPQKLQPRSNSGGPEMGGTTSQQLLSYVKLVEKHESGPDRMFVANTERGVRSMGERAGSNPLPVTSNASASDFATVRHNAFGAASVLVKIPSVTQSANTCNGQSNAQTSISKAPLFVDISQLGVYNNNRLYIISTDSQSGNPVFRRVSASPLQSQQTTATLNTNNYTNNQFNAFPTFTSNNTAANYASTASLPSNTANATHSSASSSLEGAQGVKLINQIPLFATQVQHTAPQPIVVASKPTGIVLTPSRLKLPTKSGASGTYKSPNSAITGGGDLSPHLQNVNLSVSNTSGDQMCVNSSASVVQSNLHGPGNIHNNQCTVNVSNSGQSNQRDAPRLNSEHRRHSASDFVTSLGNSMRTNPLASSSFSCNRSFQRSNTIASPVEIADEIYQAQAKPFASLNSCHNTSLVNNVNSPADNYHNVAANSDLVELNSDSIQQSQRDEMQIQEYDMAVDNAVRDMNIENNFNQKNVPFANPQRTNSNDIILQAFTTAQSQQDHETNVSHAFQHVLSPLSLSTLTTSTDVITTASGFSEPVSTAPSMTSSNDVPMQTSPTASCVLAPLLPNFDDLGDLSFLDDHKLHDSSTAEDLIASLHSSLHSPTLTQNSVTNDTSNVSAVAHDSNPSHTNPCTMNYDMKPVQSYNIMTNSSTNSCFNCGSSSKTVAGFSSTPSVNSISVSENVPLYAELSPCTNSMTHQSPCTNTMTHHHNSHPGSTIAHITDFCPEWSYSTGGAKVLVTGPWYAKKSSYSVLFGEKSVSAQLVQSGVLKCYSPAHIAGSVALKVLCDNQMISNAVTFTFRARSENSPPPPSVLTPLADYDLELKNTLLQRLKEMNCRLVPVNDQKFTVDSMFENIQNQITSKMECAVLQCVSSLKQRPWVRGNEPIHSSDGLTLLHLAAALGYSKLIQELFCWKAERPCQVLDYEVDTLALDRKCCTPLMWACAMGHIQTARSLCGLRPSALSVANADGKLPLQVACDRGFIELAHSIQQLIHELQQQEASRLNVESGSSQESEFLLSIEEQALLDQVSGSSFQSSEENNSYDAIPHDQTSGTSSNSCLPSHQPLYQQAQQNKDAYLPSQSHITDLSGQYGCITTNSQSSIPSQVGLDIQGGCDMETNSSFHVFNDPEKSLNYSNEAHSNQNINFKKESIDLNGSSAHSSISDTSGHARWFTPPKSPLATAFQTPATFLAPQQNVIISSTVDEQVFKVPQSVSVLHSTPKTQHYLHKASHRSETSPDSLQLNMNNINKPSNTLDTNPLLLQVSKTVGMFLHGSGSPKSTFSGKSRGLRDIRIGHGNMDVKTKRTKLLKRISVEVLPEWFPNTEASSGRHSALGSELNTKKRDIADPHQGRARSLTLEETHAHSLSQSPCSPVNQNFGDAEYRSSAQTLLLDSASSHTGDPSLRNDPMFSMSGRDLNSPVIFLPMSSDFGDCGGLSIHDIRQQHIAMETAESSCASSCTSASERCLNPNGSDECMQDQSAEEKQGHHMATLANQIIAAMPERIKLSPSRSDDSAPEELWMKRDRSSSYDSYSSAGSCKDLCVGGFPSGPPPLSVSDESELSAPLDTIGAFEDCRYADLGTPTSSLSPASSLQHSPYMDHFSMDSPPPTTEEFNEYFNAPQTYLEKDFSQLTLSDAEQRKLYEAAKIIQNFYRRYKDRQEQLMRQRQKEVEAVVLIQSYYRRYKQYMYTVKMTQAAVLIQSQFRSYYAQKRFKQSRQAATLIQNRYRAYKEQERYKKRKDAAVLIQQRFRNHYQRLRGHKTTGQQSVNDSAQKCQEDVPNPRVSCSNRSEEQTKDTGKNN